MPNWPANGFSELPESAIFMPSIACHRPPALKFLKSDPYSLAVTLPWNSWANKCVHVRAWKGPGAVCVDFVHFHPLCCISLVQNNYNYAGLLVSASFESMQKLLAEVPLLRCLISCVFLCIAIRSLVPRSIKKRWGAEGLRSVRA